MIRIDPGADEDWAVGGTYLAFLRLAADLVGWRRLTRTDQELASLLSVYGAGVYFGPPVVDGEPFPGAAALGG